MCGGGEEAMPREATTFCKSSITKSGGQGRVEGSKGRRVEGSKGRRVEGSKGRRVPFFQWSCPLKVLRIRVIFCSEATLRIFLGCFATVIEGFLCNPSYYCTKASSFA